MRNASVRIFVFLVVALSLAAAFRISPKTQVKLGNGRKERSQYGVEERSGAEGMWIEQKLTLLKLIGEHGFTAAS